MKKVLLVLCFLVIFSASIFANQGFLKAAENGDVALVKEYLELGVNVNVKSNEMIISDRTAIMYAAKNNHPEVVKILLNAGAELNDIASSMGYTPLMYACRSNYNTDDTDTNIEVITLLIKGGADVNFSTTATFFSTATFFPLIVAARYKNTEAVRILINAGADVNAQDYEGNTALMWASANGNAIAVKLLLAAKADVNIKNNKGQTAIDLAKDTTIMKLLKGMPVDLTNYK